MIAPTVWRGPGGLVWQLDVEFDSPFTVTDAGTLEDGPSGLYGPAECWHDDERDIDLCGAEADWRPLTGWTGQHGYRGAVMHPSEFLGGRLAAHILETPGTYVLVPVGDLESDELIGWSVLEYVGSEAR